MADEKRLIDADFTKTAIKDYVANNEVSEGFAEIAGLICNMLDACETVYAVKVVHGWWLKGTKSLISGSIIVGHCCSVCNEFSVINSNYCPNCGAKMDGDGNGDGNG